MTQYAIGSTAWTLIAGPGVSGSCWLDEDGDGASGRVDCRIITSSSAPSLSDATKGRRVWTPSGNSDFCYFSAKDSTVSTWAICRDGSATISVDDSIGAVTVKAHPFNTEPDGALRAQIQDNDAEPVSIRFVKKILDVALATNSIIDTNDITLVAGHGAVIGDVICLREAGRFYQGLIVNVATNVITLNSPLDYAYTTSAQAFRSSHNMAVNGAITPQVFAVSPPAGTSWHIYSVDVAITDASPMDDGTFGGLPQLTKGIVFRRVNGVHKNYFAVRNNGEFHLRTGTVEYSTKAPSGQYGISAGITFPDHNGIAVYLEYGDLFEIIIQDDLTGLVTFDAVVSGHVVT